MKIVIPDYRAKSRNLTNMKYWRVYQAHRNEIAELIMAYCREKLTVSPAVVTIEAFYKGKQHVDTSNH